MHGAGLVSWDLSGIKDPALPIGALYIGPEERSYIRVLSRYACRISPGVVPIRSSGSVGLRTYALIAAGRISAYVVNGRSHTQPTTGARLVISSPTSGTATFVSPADGSILGTVPVRAGSTSVPLPRFVTDLAVTIRR